MSWHLWSVLIALDFQTAGNIVNPTNRVVWTAMKQAKTFDERELRTAFACIATRRLGVRDRAIVAISFYGGLRAHEIASLTVGCVRGADGAVVREFLLSRSQTKGKQGRKVFLSEKLRKEIANFLARAQITDPGEPLFKTQKGHRFTANAMCHLFRDIYRQAGIRGASSHSGRPSFGERFSSSARGPRGACINIDHAALHRCQRSPAPRRGRIGGLRVSRPETIQTHQAIVL
jgi:integrase/recombinase XerD